MTELKHDKTLTRRQVGVKAKEYFKGKTQFATLINRALDQSAGTMDLPAVWKVNVETLSKEFDNIPFFDETMRLDRPNSAFHVVGGKSHQYKHSDYCKVFP